MALYLGLINNGIFVSADNYNLKDINDVYLTALPSTNKLKVNLNGVAYRLKIELPVKESD